MIPRQKKVPPHMGTETWANIRDLAVEQGWTGGSAGPVWALGRVQPAPPIGAFPGASPSPGITALPRTTQTPECAPSCRAGDIPGRRQRLALLPSLHTCLRHFFLAGSLSPGLSGRSSPNHALACDGKTVENRPESLPGLPMSFV